MKRSWIAVEMLLVLFMAGSLVHAGPIVKPVKPLGPGQIQPVPVPPGAIKLVPKPGPKIVPPPKPLPGVVPKPVIPPGGFKLIPRPKPKPGPKPKGKKHPHHPHWTKLVPKVHLHLGGGSKTTVVERVPYDPHMDPHRPDPDVPHDPNLDREPVHPDPVVIRSIAYYPFPGDGGLWMPYRGRECYVFDGLLYVKVKEEPARYPFRRIAIPQKLAERLAEEMAEAEESELFLEDE